MQSPSIQRNLDDCGGFSPRRRRPWWWQRAAAVVVDGGGGDNQQQQQQQRQQQQRRTLLFPASSARSGPGRTWKGVGGWCSPMTVGAAAVVSILLLWYFEAFDETLLKSNYLQERASTLLTTATTATTAGGGGPVGTAEWKRRRRPPERGEVTVAYAVSLIKCGDHQSNVGGMTDAAAVLRHSVHRLHAGDDGDDNGAASRYGYKMYAFVHEQAEGCSQGLKDLGYTVLVKDTPIQLEEVQSETLRKILPRAWCCGQQEFIKLYAYTLLEHELVVHVDVDFLFTRGMDDLFDAMLVDAGSSWSSDARSRVPVERPDEPWPTVVEAAMTRDWPQVRPGRVPGFQAGFIVLRPSLSVFDEIVRTIRTAEYVPGFARDNGWGGKVT